MLIRCPSSAVHVWCSAMLRPARRNVISRGNLEDGLERHLLPCSSSGEGTEGVPPANPPRRSGGRWAIRVRRRVPLRQLGRGLGRPHGRPSVWEWPQPRGSGRAMCQPRRRRGSCDGVMMRDLASYHDLGRATAPRESGGERSQVPITPRKLWVRAGLRGVE